MRKQTRKPCPKVLLDHGARWTAALIKNGKWTNWPQHQTRKLNHILKDEGLREQTQHHCSYCDSYPIEPPGTETIDHFRPKSKFPELALEWTNLFFCCNYCQSKKLERFEEALIKPDDSDYDFDLYFQWNFDTGELHPNEVASPEMKYRAERTIEMLSLNQAHPPLRLAERDSYVVSDGNHIDTFCYRDFLARA